MSDPLSITAGVVGITAATVDSIRSLITSTRCIQQAPKTVEQIGNDLNGIESAISSLNKAVCKGDHVADPLKSIMSDVKLAVMVNNCGDSCKAFQKSLAKWTKHTTPTHISIRDRICIAFEENAISAFHSQVSACKQTLDIAINTSTLLAQEYQMRMSDKMRKVLEELEKNMLQLAKVTESKIERTRTIETQLQAMKEECESCAERDDTQHIIDFVADERRTWNHYKTACEWVYKQARSKRTGVKVEKVKISDSTFAAVGITNINPKDLENVDVQVGVQDVVVSGKAIGFVGVQHVDLNAGIFKDRE